MYGSDKFADRTSNGFACRVWLAFVILACQVASGCSLMPGASKTETKPYTLNLSLTASENLNPNSQSRPSPVQVRVFIVERQTDFGTKSFEEVFEYSGNVMDPKPLATSIIRPGETRNLVLPADRSLTQLVLVAAFRDPYESRWMARAIISPIDTVDASATISANQVIINPTP